MQLWIHIPWLYQHIIYKVDTAVFTVFYTVFWQSVQSYMKVHIIIFIINIKTEGFKKQSCTVAGMRNSKNACLPASNYMTKFSDIVIILKTMMLFKWGCCVGWEQ